MLDLSTLQWAIGALGRALSVTGDDRRRQKFDAETQKALKAGVMQSFQVTCEDWPERGSTGTGARHGLGVRLTKPIVEASGVIEPQRRKPLLADKLAAFDPKRHGGEAMAFRPLCKEVL